MSPPTESRIDLTRVPLAFAEGGVAKKAVYWNSQCIIDAGATISCDLIEAYRDIAMHLPVSLRPDGGTEAAQMRIEENIRRHRLRQSQAKMRDLSERYKAGTTVFDQGDGTNRDCFFLAEGSVGIYRDGRQLALLDRSGAPIGEMSYLTGEPRSATVKAETDVLLLRLAHEQGNDLLRTQTTLAATLLESLAQRLSETSRRAVETGRELEEARKALADLQASLSPEAQELVRLKESLTKLRDFAMREAGLRAGNTDLLATVLESVRRSFGERLGPAGAARDLMTLLEDYLQYLQAQERRSSVRPVHQHELMSDRLRRWQEEERG